MIVAVSLGLLILRIIAGLTMAVHGAEKTFGWFGGAGFSRTTQMMQSQRFKPALFWVALGSNRSQLLDNSGVYDAVDRKMV